MGMLIFCLVVAALSLFAGGIGTTLTCISTHKGNDESAQVWSVLSLLCYLIAACCVSDKTMQSFIDQIGPLFVLIIAISFMTEGFIFTLALYKHLTSKP